MIKALITFAFFFIVGIIIMDFIMTPDSNYDPRAVHKWENWEGALIVNGISQFNQGIGIFDSGLAILTNTSYMLPSIQIGNVDPGALSFTEFQLFNDAGQVGNIFTTTNALGAFLPRYNNSLFVSTVNGGNLILGNIVSGDIIFTAGGINNRFEILGSGAVNSYVPTYMQSSLRANDYYSGDNSQGITNTASYWLCTNSGCTTSCQVQIKDGLITGCT